jgi:hypothetical protein
MTSKTKKVKNNFYMDYTPVDALAIAFEVYEDQGFIRSGDGYSVWNDETQDYTRTFDNKTIIIEKMKSGYRPSEDNMTRSSEYIDKVVGKLMFKKMSGSMNSFDSSIVKATSEDLTNFSVAVIASMPHGAMVNEKRERLEERMSFIKHSSEYFGNKGTRYDLEAVVLDAKYIQSREVYMITLLHNDRDVLKFWWSQQPDLCDLMENKTIKFRGTVNRHETNKYTQCKETIINRVKIQSI